jgi:hypothetical protein
MSQTLLAQEHARSLPESCLGQWRRPTTAIQKLTLVAMASFRRARTKDPLDPAPAAAFKKTNLRSTTR